VSDLWPAPTADGPVRGTVTVPGSKSVTNRALVLAAVASGPSRLRRPLRSRDTALMVSALRALGADIDDTGLDWQVTPAALRGPADVDVGLAGTVMRFVPPVATLADGSVRLDGDARARERPMRPLLHALRALGAEIDDGGRGALPLRLHGRGGLPGGDVSVDASASSQIVTALLLPAARWEHGVVVRHTGSRKVPNAPHIAMTIAMLRERGVDAGSVDGSCWRVLPGAVSGRDDVVEPDLSSAAPFLAAAVVTGGEVRVRDWPAASSQPGALLPDLLAAFGGSWRRDGDDLVVSGSGDVVGADVDLRDGGELTPVVAAIAAVASTPSTIRGVDYLRGHETDRLAALATEINRLGGEVVELDDGLRIDPRPLHGDVFRTYADHRLAMAAAVLGLVTADVQVEDVATTGKTYPSFVRDWAALVTGEPG
jgi:3-phosphoshikimate 1-carboxyvinyltransferase